MAIQFMGSLFIFENDLRYELCDQQCIRENRIISRQTNRFAAIVQDVVMETTHVQSVQK